MSYKSVIDRSSVKSAVSKKRQTIEEYISSYVGIDFYNLVL